MRSTADRDIGSAEALLVAVSEPTRGHHTIAGTLEALLPAAVLLNLADDGQVTIGEGWVTRSPGAGAEERRGYERSALALGGRLDGPLTDVLRALSDGLRPLHDAVAAELVAEGRVTSARNGLFKMDFGYRFPVAAPEFRDAIRSRVQKALETGDVTPPFGRAALLLAAGRLGATVFPCVDTGAMDAVVAGDASRTRGRAADGTLVALQQLTAAIRPPRR